MSDPQEFRADDLTALNNLIVSASRFGGSGGVVANGMLGYNTARDPLSHSQIVPTRELTPRECIDLYEGDRLFRVLVDALPLRSPAPIWTFGSHEDNDDEVNSDDVTKYLDRAARNGNNYAMSSTQQALGQVANSQDLYQFLNPDSGFMNLFRSCAQDARMFKTSYILIGVDDGMDWEEPLNWEGIRSLRWLKHLSFNEIIPKDNPSDPEFYEVKVKQGEGTEGSNRNKRLVHQSRVVRLLGHPLPLAAAQIKSCPATSVIQSFYPAYSRLIQCLQSATNMVASHSAFTSGIQGLGEMTKTPEGRQKLFNRLESMMMSMSSLRGIMYDTNGEKVDYINRQYAGIKDIIDIQLDYVTAQSDTPRFLLFGTSNRSGLGAEGRGEQESLQFAQAMRTWVNTHLRDPMLYLGTIALLAEDFPEGNGVLPEGFNVEFPSILELDPLSIAKILVEYTEAYTKAAEAGFVDKTEVRRSLFEPASLPLSGTIDLDDRISEMMEEALEGAIEGDIEDEDIEDDEEDLEEGDRTTEEESEDIEGEAIDPDDEDRGDRSDCAECFDYRADDALWDEAAIEAWGVAHFDAEADNKLFFFEKGGVRRRTGIISSSAAGARKKCQRGCGRLYRVRKMTTQEKKQARAGKWVRSGPSSSQKAGYGTSRGYGPPRSKKRKDSTDDRFDVITRDPDTGEFILWTGDRSRILGRHKSKKAAEKQELAIEISKHQKSDESHETCDDSEISEFLSESDDDELQQEREHLQQLFESGEIDEEDFDELMGFLSGMKIAVIGDAIEAIDELELEQLREDSKNEPTNKKLWAEAISAAKRKFKIYPSAYANLWASRYYSRKGGKWRIARSDSFEVILDDWRSELQGNVEISAEECLERLDDLREWLRERWLALNASGRVVGVCGSGKTRGKVKCLPESKIKSMSLAERIAAVRRKRKEDPNPDRKGKAIHVSTHGKKDEQDTENRSDALRLTELPQVGSRVKYKGRLYVPNRPYKSGDRMVVLATRNGYAKLVNFSAEDVDLEKEFHPHQPQFWSKLYFSFGSPQVEEPETATDDRTDVESIEVSGDILDESEFDELGAINLLQTLENIFEDGDR